MRKLFLDDVHFVGDVFLFAAIMTAISAPASAVAAENCSQMSSQMDINACYQRAYETADSNLQTTYTTLIKKLPPDGAAQLRTAQRGWVIYKDNWCKFQSSMTKDGSMYPTVLASCLTKLTNEQLERLAYQNTCTEDTDCAPKR